MSARNKKNRKQQNRKFRTSSIEKLMDRELFAADLVGAAEMAQATSEPVQTVEVATMEVAAPALEKIESSVSEVQASKGRYLDKASPLIRQVGTGASEIMGPLRNGEVDAGSANAVVENVANFNEAAAGLGEAPELAASIESAEKTLTEVEANVETDFNFVSGLVEAGDKGDTKTTWDVDRNTETLVVDSGGYRYHTWEWANPASSIQSPNYHTWEYEDPFSTSRSVERGEGSSISVTGNEDGTVSVEVNGEVFESLPANTRVVIHGTNGDDVIVANGSFKYGLIIIGGGGDDVIVGSNGNDISRFCPTWCSI